MPEFIPQTQLPTGLASQVLDIIRQRNQQPDALQAAITNLGNVGAEFFKGKARRAEQAQQDWKDILATGKFQPKVDVKGNPISPPPGAPLTPQTFSQYFEVIPQTFVDRQTGQIISTAPRGAKVLPKQEEKAAVNDIDKQNYKRAYGHAMPDIITELSKDQRKQLEDMAKAAVSSQSREKIAGGKTDLTTDKEWGMINRVANPAVAMRGSLLGIVGQNNARANRAWEILNDPKVDVPAKAFAITDLAAIMQGGVPHEMQLKDASYKTIYDNMAQWRTYLLKKPTALNQPEIFNRIKTLVKQLKDVDNRVISDNLSTIEQNPGYSKLISKNPEQWLEYRNKIVNNSRDIHITASERYAELERMGLKKQAIYSQLHSEGF